MNAFVRYRRSRRRTSRPAARAAAALTAYTAHPQYAPALAALYGYPQITGHARQLVDAPARLAVLTADALALVHPKTGEIDVRTALEQFAAYQLDSAGRFVFRYDDAAGPVRVAGFRPVAGPDAALSTCAAAALFVNRATETWQQRTGRPFINNWAALARTNPSQPN